MQMLQSKTLFGQFFSTIYCKESFKHKPKDIQKKELNKETDVKKTSKCYKQISPKAFSSLHKSFDASNR